MCRVEVTKTETQISVSSPYTPDLPARARALGGKWDPAAKAWRFDARLEADVAALYREVYGEWPGEAADYVTLRVTALNDVQEERGGIFVANRCLARARGRDTGAFLGDGVILRGGRFRSGGSRNYWATIMPRGTTVEVMDVPRPAAEEALDEYDGSEDLALEILEAAAPAIDRAALEEEKARLLARIAEIDALLEK